jgi:hypothetical protein
MLSIIASRRSFGIVEAITCLRSTSLGNFSRNDKTAGMLSGSIVTHCPWAIKFLSPYKSSQWPRVSSKSASCWCLRWYLPSSRSRFILYFASKLEVMIRPSSTLTRSNVQMTSCMIISRLDQVMIARPTSNSISGETPCWYVWSARRGVIGGFLAMVLFPPPTLCACRHRFLRGHVNYVNRPNTWRHRPSLQREERHNHCEARARDGLGRQGCSPSWHKAYTA